MLQLTSLQEAAAAAGDHNFMIGPAGSGKSTVLHQRLGHLLISGEPSYTVLVLISEPEHRPSFLDTIHQIGVGSYSDLNIVTYSELAREMVTLFWPLIARPAGFKHAYQPPTYLGYDLAQLLIWRIITPMLDEGAFSDIPLRPQQIVSQILDTLNRAALNGLSLDQTTGRQVAAWSGERDHIRHLEAASAAAHVFRQTCLDNNLLDLSLITQVFDTHLVHHPAFHQYFSERYRHLMVDNVEEQTPAGQNFIRGLMSTTQSTLIAYDSGGGYKRFLAADPGGARQFRDLCSRTFEFPDSFVTPLSLSYLSNHIQNCLVGGKRESGKAQEAILGSATGRYRHEMVDELIATLLTFLDEGLPPDEIAIITPYLDGALRYNLTKKLNSAGIPYRILRRRSPPREEPRVRALLTWLALAHPDWGVFPVPYDVTEALSLSIASMDVARAKLVTDYLYDQGGQGLSPADQLPDPIMDRIGQDLVELVEALRLWLIEEGAANHPIDAFLHDLFNFLLALPAFQPEPDLSAAAVCDWLVRAAGRFRHAAGPMGINSQAEIGRVFIEGVYQGLVTANPPDLGDPPDPDGLTISTIYGYLLAGRPVEVQVWLETSASGWWDIPRQPLSNAFVLTPSWPADRPWTAEDDYQIRNELLSRIINGLVNRCRSGVILATSELDRRGLRQEGPLWQAMKGVT